MNPELFKIRKAIDRLCLAAIGLSVVVGVVAVQLFAIICRN
jgi:hypothetical protein